jgi:hypothetical protein
MGYSFVLSLFNWKLVWVVKIKLRVGISRVREKIKMDFRKVLYWVIIVCLTLAIGTTIKKEIEREHPELRKQLPKWLRWF